MKAFKLLLLFLIISGYRLQSQVTVTPITSDSVLINQLQGFGLTINNMSVTAAPGSLASYSGSPSISFGNGIIMSTGKADSRIFQTAIWPLSDKNGYPGNALLNFGGNNTFDACTIDFDCVPNSNILLFDFAFASEEYPGYIGLGFNDVFGIFVTGINPQGGQYVNKNFALVPGTSLPVSIDNINNGNTNTGPCKNCAYYVHNTAGNYFAYDGYTTSLQGVVPVVPGQPYHFAITIADSGDSLVDSAVLLKTYSFRSSLATDIKAYYYSNEIELYPMPADDKIYLSSESKIISMELLSIEGKKITSINISENSIDVSSVDAGIYFLHLSTANGSIVKKVVIE